MFGPMCVTGDEASYQSTGFEDDGGRLRDDSIPHFALVVQNACRQNDPPTAVISGHDFLKTCKWDRSGKRRVCLWLAAFYLPSSPFFRRYQRR